MTDQKPSPLPEPTSKPEAVSQVSAKPEAPAIDPETAKIQDLLAKRMADPKWALSFARQMKFLSSALDEEAMFLYKLQNLRAYKTEQIRRIIDMLDGSFPKD